MKRQPGKDYRFSIIPAAAVTDGRLERGDVVLLALLGRHTDDNGWCRRSQVTMAEELCCSRGTVQRSLKRLIEAGYVQEKAEGRGRAPAPNVKDGEQPFAAYSYRVLFDLEHRTAGGCSQVSTGGAHDEGARGAHPELARGAHMERAPLIEPTPLEGSPLEPDARARGIRWDVIGDCLIAVCHAMAAGKKPKSQYSSDFERFWTECRKWPGFSPNMSKPEALKAWQQAKDARPETGEMVAAAREYGRWLTAENDARAKRRGVRPHPTLHPATWLRQRRWTGFLDALALREANSDPDWKPRPITLAPEHVEALRNAGMSEQLVASWFADGEYRALPVPTFIAATIMKRDWIERHYMRELKRAFGVHEITITVKQESKAA